MNQERYNNVKNSKPFKVCDVFLYVCLALIIALLFLFPLLKKSQVNGVKITYLGQEIFRFNYDEKEYEVFDFNGEIVTNKEDNGLIVTIYYGSDKESFNVVYIDYVEKTAVMKDSTCSNQKDCTYTPKIKDKGAIICAPNGLKITPVDGVLPLVTG